MTKNYTRLFSLNIRLLEKHEFSLFTIMYGSTVASSAFHHDTVNVYFQNNNICSVYIIGASPYSLSAVVMTAVFKRGVTCFFVLVSKLVITESLVAVMFYKEVFS